MKQAMELTAATMSASEYTVSLSKIATREAVEQFKKLVAKDVSFCKGFSEMLPLVFFGAEMPGVEALKSLDGMSNIL